MPTFRHIAASKARPDVDQVELARATLRRLGEKSRSTAGVLAETRGRPAGAATEDEPLEQRVARQPVRAVDAVRGHLATGEEAGDAGGSVGVHLHAADRVVGGWMGRDGHRRGIDLELPQPRRQRREPALESALDPPRIDVDARIAGFAEHLGDPGRHDVAGCEVAEGMDLPP